MCKAPDLQNDAGAFRQIDPSINAGIDLSAQSQIASTSIEKYVLLEPAF